MQRQVDANTTSRTHPGDSEVPRRERTASDGNGHPELCRSAWGKMERAAVMVGLGWGMPGIHSLLEALLPSERRSP